MKEPQLKLIKKIIIGVIAFQLLVALYLTAVYSQNPWIARMRTAYIETAMSTNSHQWLAKWFLPDSVIDKVMEARKQNADMQKGLSTKWDKDEEKKEEKRSFYEIYWELDTPSVRDYFVVEPDLENDDILIEDYKDMFGLRTVNGDPVVVIDTENNLLIVAVSGPDYVGKLAIVKDPRAVEMVPSKNLGSRGQEAIEYATEYDTALVINASAFKDADGHGSGGEANGSMIIDGQEYGKPRPEKWMLFGMKYDDRFYISNYKKAKVEDYRWGTEFTPALIVNGVNQRDENYGMGIHPRTAIGQAKNGDFLCLIIDGRQVGYSLGCTVWDCADILEKYGAYQAGNLDGGSSSVMLYKDKQITSSSSATGKGRYMPSALIVNKSQNIKTDENKSTPQNKDPGK